MNISTVTFLKLQATIPIVETASNMARNLKVYPSIAVISNRQIRIGVSENFLPP
jgi:hypothetical protein